MVFSALSEIRFFAAKTKPDRKICRQQECKMSPCTKSLTPPWSNVNQDARVNDDGPTSGPILYRFTFTFAIVEQHFTGRISFC